MKNRSVATWTLAAAAAVALVTVATEAQVKKGKTRATPTSTIMKCVMKPNCDGLKKALDGTPDDKAWGSMALQAGLLNEMSYNLMDDGRCPDKTWAEAAGKTLRTSSGSLMAAIEGKKLEDAKTAFKTLTTSCKSCHDAHRKKD